MSGLYFSKKTDLKPKVQVFHLDVKKAQTQESFVTLSDNKSKSAWPTALQSETSWYHCYNGQTLWLCEEHSIVRKKGPGLLNENMQDFSPLTSLAIPDPVRPIAINLKILIFKT